MKTLEELQPLIIEWAKEKDLIHIDIAPKQRLKLIEECGELASAILKNDVKLQKDAIGDIFVVLVILSEQVSYEICLDQISIVHVHLDESICDIIRESTYNLIQNSIIYLNSISYELNLDLTECANIAWNEIKDRKGKTINGTFIKQS